MFFIVAAGLFPLGVGPETETLRQIAPGVVWVCALLAAMLSINQLYAADHADGSLEAVHGYRAFETADDPATLFVDESSRPDVAHGGNYNEQLHQMRVDEAKHYLEALALRVGAVALDVAYAALTKR